MNEAERKMYMLIEGIGTVINAGDASAAYSSMKGKTTAFLSYDSFWPSAVASGRSMSSKIYNVDGSLTLFFAIDAYKIQYEYGETTTSEGVNLSVTGSYAVSGASLALYGSSHTTHCIEVLGTEAVDTEDVDYKIEFGPPNL